MKQKSVAAETTANTGLANTVYRLIYRTMPSVRSTAVDQVAYRKTILFSYLLTLASIWGLSTHANANPIDRLLSVVSSPMPEYGLVLTPDGDTAVFARKSGPWGQSGSRSVLYVSYRQGSDWTDPTPVFSEASSADDPFFSPDGSTLYFTTNRVFGGGVKADSDIWVIDYSTNTFRNPRPVENVNSAAEEYSPVLTADGSLYFASSRDGGLGAGDIWVSRSGNGAFQAPENLGAPVNTAGGEWNVFVATNQRYLVVEASGRADAKSPSGDFYLHNKNGKTWGPAIPLAHINTTGSDLLPRLSPNDQYFLYTSTGSAGSVDADILAIDKEAFLNANGEPANEQLLVVSRSNHEIVALNPDTLNEIARYPAGPGAHEVAVSLDGKTAYAPNYGVYPKPHTEPILPSQMQFTSEPSDTLSRVDLSAPSGTDKIAICSHSHGTTVSPDGHVWVTCQNEGRVLELAGTSGALIKSWPAGDMGSHSLVATRDNRFVVTSNVDAGSVSIFNRTDDTVNRVKTGQGAEGLALTPDHSHVWVGNTQANTISVVRIADGAITQAFPSHGRFPVKMIIAPDGSETWIVNTFSSEIAILDAVNGELKEKLTFDSPPLGILISPDGERVYVTFPRLNEVRSFERNTRTEIARTDGVMEGDGMAWAKPKS